MESVLLGEGRRAYRVSTGGGDLQVHVHQLYEVWRGEDGLVRMIPEIPRTTSKVKSRFSGKVFRYFYPY